jgi:hypothetical protein
MIVLENETSYVFGESYSGSEYSPMNSDTRVKFVGTSFRVRNLTLVLEVEAARTVGQTVLTYGNTDLRNKHNRCVWSGNYNEIN